MTPSRQLAEPDRGAWGLIVAAGRGRRLGSPKQFLRVGGRPLLWYSLSAFERCPAIAGYVVVVLSGREAMVRRLCLRAGFRRLHAVVPGGRERVDSVQAGLAVLPGRGTVVVHDAARPLLTPAMLSCGIAAARRGPVTFAVPVADTLKRVANGRVTATVPRAGLWAVQTPQFFSLALLRRAHRAATDNTATDDCALVERLGVRPRVMLSPTPNIKVTTAADLALVRELL